MSTGKKVVVARDAEWAMAIVSALAAMPNPPTVIPDAPVTPEQVPAFLTALLSAARQQCVEAADRACASVRVAMPTRISGARRVYHAVSKVAGGESGT